MKRFLRAVPDVITGKGLCVAIFKSVVIKMKNYPTGLDFFHMDDYDTFDRTS